ncbi:MAG: S8 family serine peptidase [Lacibacter sp.]
MKQILLKRKKTLLGVLFLSISLSIHAQKTVSTLRLKTGDQLVKGNMTAEQVTQEFRKGRFAGITYSLLFFEKPLTLSQQQQLKNIGVELLSYLPDNCYQARMKQVPALAQLYQLGVRAAMNMPGAFKLGVELKEQMAGNISDAPLLISLQLLPGVKWNEVQPMLTFYGVTLSKADYLNQGLAQVIVPGNKISSLSELPFIAYINVSNLKSEPLNQREKGMFGLTNLTGAEVAGRNLNGTGIAIGIGDNADPLHIDLIKDVINRNPTYVPVNHGRMVAGTVGGDGIIEEKYAGVATKSLLITDYYDYVLTKSALYYSDYNMTVTNNSYYTGLANCPGNSMYNELSVYVDEQMYNNPFLQHIFAAGNDGTKTCSPYPASFATIKSGYQVGKNSLDVGDYSISSDNLNTSSSRGPVNDGRIKPEIIASGSQVTTTYYNNTYSSGWGTSHSAPLVTGVWALLTERYKQLHSDAYPKAALLKAVICNSGDDRGNAGPDFSWGFGLINPRKAVEMVEQDHYFTSTASTGSLNNQVISVPAGTKQLKVMLYWHDKEGSPLAANALVNDLDLTVTDGATTYQPWILDPAPFSVSNIATRGADHINNIEQVTIDNPGTSVTVSVSGLNVPSGPQEYFVTYEFLQSDIKIEFPYGGERFSPGQAEVIRWNPTDNSTNPFTIEISLDDGSTWAVIDNNVSATLNRYIWTVPATPTNKGKIRVSRNGTGTAVASPGNFTILAQPVLSTTVPCEGYVDLSWAAVTGATDYEVMQLINDQLASVGTTASTTYRISGLDKTKGYWFTVRARMTDSLGMRATARSVTPSLATPCSAAAFNNDLKIDALVSPVNGRKNTSSQLSSSQQITVRIKNLDDAATAGSYDISYQVNGGTIVTETSSASISAGATINYTFTAVADMSVASVYSVRVFVKQTGDVQTANDEQTYIVKHADNQAVVLPFSETFESAAALEFRASEFAIANADRFDFATANSNGRLRTFINSGFAVNGNRSATLDAANFSGLLSNNQLTGTINLNSYTGSQNLRFDFKYKNFGQLKNPATGVWMRGSDASAWVKIYDLNTGQANPGEVKQVTYNISDLGQAVTSSFQVRFDQQGYASANNGSYAADVLDIDDGFAFDDIRVVAATNDVMLTAITAPEKFDCSPGNKSITISVRNTTASPFTNVPVYYRINGGTAVAEIIPSLPANSVTAYTFSTQADFSISRAYIIDAWVKQSGDDYPVNDSVTNNIVYTTPSINSFPYLERFETSNGYWFTDTLSYSSWEWGAPAKAKIDRSANGGNGWYTSLYSTYKSNESSYLYSPCFNLSTLTQPVLSFSHIFQQEDNCDCDNSTLEYSTDNGTTWQSLTASNATNWFDVTANQTWKASLAYWHVASTEVPNAANIRFRFLISADNGTEYEGIGVDDIHIFDKATIYTGADQTNMNQTVSGSNWIDFTSGGKVVASINPLGQNLGSTDVSVYFNTSGSVRYVNNQYYLDRNIVIRPASIPADSVLVRFYFTDQEALALINATGCTGCSTIKDAFLAGVTKFSGTSGNENGTIADNAGGSYLFITPSAVDVVPFNNGYYAEFKVKTFSEFWINSGGTNFNQSLPVTLLNFTGVMKGNDVELQWQTTNEVNTEKFEVERKTSLAAAFTPVATINALNNNGVNNYRHTDKDAGDLDRHLYYRLKMIDNNGSSAYSNIVLLSAENQTVFIRGIHNQPAKTILIEKGNNPGISKINISVVNSTGTVVLSKNTTYQNTLLDLGSMPGGIYMIRVQDQSGGESYIQKVIIR